MAKKENLMKFLSGFAAAVFALSLVACGDDSSDFIAKSGNESGEKSSSSGASSSSFEEEPEVPCDLETEYNEQEGTLTDGRDCHVYKTVKIGDQVWMAENLNYKVDSSFCQKHDPRNCSKYGRLYTWSGAVDKPGDECEYERCNPPSGYRGVCPEGWHLSDIADWNLLIKTAGGEKEAKMKLRSTSGWNDGTLNDSAVYVFCASEDGWDVSYNGTDDYGFTVLPAGNGADLKRDGYCLGVRAAFWLLTESDYDRAAAWCVEFQNNYMSMETMVKVNTYSVRCVKDNE